MKIEYPRNAKEKADLADMAARAFAGNYDTIRKRYALEMEKNPSLQTEYLRMIKRDGSIAAHVGVHRKTLKIGRASLDMGGLGMVSCLPEMRGKGLASACIKGTVSYMRECGMDLSTLFGIDRFYTKFGYTGCLPRYTLKMHVNELSNLNNRFDVKPYAKPDLPALLALYSAASAQTPGAIERTLKAFGFAIGVRELLPQKKTRENARQDRAIHVFKDKSKAGEARAYVIWIDGGPFEVAMEPGDDAVCEAVLAWMRQKRIDALEKEVHLTFLCPAHPLWQYALRFNHSTETRFSHTGDGMGLILNIGSFLDKMQPEFESRIDSSGMVAECHLHLKVDGDEHNLILCRSHHITNAAANVMAASVSCSKQSLLQMCLGNLAPESLPDVKVSGMKTLANALFPASTPTMYMLDHF